LILAHGRFQSLLDGVHDVLLSVASRGQLRQVPGCAGVSENVLRDVRGVSDEACAVGGMVDQRMRNERDGRIVCVRLSTVSVERFVGEALHATRGQNRQPV
jgi:hypothetical protein